MQLETQPQANRLLDSPVSGARIRDLQMAKHRFSSTQTPLGRFVLFGDSITQQSFAQGGWGALLADAYARKVKRRGEREDRSL